ncbi:MAG TPA: DUF2911 domain-containing protein [Candidatus Methylomirabilis sp.]|nr:DUF2911 domain-containing protein [Candidatus Methylomirabilis sp.]
MKRSLVALLLVAGFGLAQRPSPPAETSVSINGKTISIKYSAPSLRGRQAFGPNGIISKDATYPVWRAGANNATALHTDADLMIGDLRVPAGNYTLFVDTSASPWQLIVNKQTGQWGLTYNKSQDLGRVPMKVTKPSAPVETYKMTLTSEGNKGKLELAWENVDATVDFMVH